jgi:fatty acid desaturase
MKVNQTNLERIIRVVIGVALALIFFTGTIAGGWGVAALVVGAVLFLTGGVGYCPLYSLVGTKVNNDN